MTRQKMFALLGLAVAIGVVLMLIGKKRAAHETQAPVAQPEEGGKTEPLTAAG